MFLARVFGLFSGARLPLFLTYIFWPDLANLPPNLPVCLAWFVPCLFGLVWPMFVAWFGVRQTMFVTAISVELSKFSATIAVRCNIFQYTTKIERLRFGLPCCYILWVLTDMSLYYFNCVSIDYMGIVVLFCFSVFFLSGIWPEEVFTVWFRALRTYNWGPKPLPPWQSISQAGWDGVTGRLRRSACLLFLRDPCISALFVTELRMSA